MKIFLANGALSVASKIQVEIRNPKEFYCDRLQQVPDDPPLLEALRQIGTSICDAADAALGRACSSIAYRVRMDGKGDSPPKSTDVVYCRFCSRCRFDLAEEEIVRVLDTALLEIHLELLPGETSWNMTASGG